jgi:hypothetical protein
MIAILTVVAALPLGLLVRNRMAAYLVYTILFSNLFTFQTANLVMEWVNGSRDAFDAKVSLGDTIPYLIVNALLGGAGYGLVTVGHWLRNRRRTGHEVRLDSQPA